MRKFFVFIFLVSIVFAVRIPARLIKA